MSGILASLLSIYYSCAKSASEFWYPTSTFTHCPRMYPHNLWAYCTNAGNLNLTESSFEASFRQWIHSFSYVYIFFLKCAHCNVEVFIRVSEKCSLTWMWVVHSHVRLLINSLLIYKIYEAEPLPKVALSVLEKRNTKDLELAPTDATLIIGSSKVRRRSEYELLNFIPVFHSKSSTGVFPAGTWTYSIIISDHVVGKERDVIFPDEACMDIDGQLYKKVLQDLTSKVVNFSTWQPKGWLQTIEQAQGGRMQAPVSKVRKEFIIRNHSSWKLYRYRRASRHPLCRTLVCKCHHRALKLTIKFY